MSETPCGGENRYLEVSSCRNGLGGFREYPAAIRLASRPSAQPGSAAAALRLLPKNSVLLLTPCFQSCSSVSLFILGGGRAITKQTKLKGGGKPLRAELQASAVKPLEMPSVGFTPAPRTGAHKPPGKTARQLLFRTGGEG